jgi:hypothetical protein
MPFLFANALLLTALAGLGIPIAIHLLLKRRQVRMPFSTLRFFSPQEPLAKSRRKLRNLLLLLLRLLIFALIVFAFARPFLPSGSPGADGRPRQQMVIVLDRSMSLMARDGQGLRWDAAGKRVRELLGALTANDKVALISCASRTEVLSGFAPPALISAKLDGLQPLYAPSDLADGLREATRLLSTVEPGFTPSIALVSDLQRSAVDRIAGSPIPPGLEVKILQVGELIASNIAVTDLQLETGDTNRPFATIANLGDEDLMAGQAEFKVDDKPLWTRPLQLKAGMSTNIEVSLPTLGEGWHRAEFRVLGKDALAADDQRQLTFIVAPPIRVLVAEGRRGVRSFAEQSFFLTAALDPFLGTTNAGAGRFRVEKVDPSQLASRIPVTGSVPTAGSQPTARLPVDVVFLPAQRALPAGLAEALARFVRAGGGLVLFVGPEATSAGFNSAFADLLPAQILKSESTEAENPWRLADVDRRTAVFDAFRTANSGNLAVPEFTQRFALQPVAGSKILARFDDGVPAVISRATGAGRVLLVNTAADTAWVDWPKHKTYVPWIHGIARYLAGRTDDRLLLTGSAATTGTETTLENLGSAGTQLRMSTPGGAETNVVIGPRGELDLEVVRPGIYRLADAAGKPVYQLAAHVPGVESDLSAVRALDLSQNLTRKESVVDTGITGNLFGPDQNRREYWRLLLMAAIALLLLETVVANRSNT